MNVSTRLSLAGTFAAAVVTAIVAVVMTATWNVRGELARNQAASEILNAVSGLRYLTLDYALHHGKRAEAQWQRRHRSLAELLADRRTAFVGRDDEVVSELREANDTVEALFAELVANQADLTGSPGRRGVAEEFDERVSGQIVVRLETMIGDALALSERSRSRVMAAQERAMLTVVTLGTTILLVVGSTIAWVRRSISRPLAALRDGTAIIGGGDLDFRLAINSRDEIGALARAFNAMAERLQSDLAGRQRTQEALERTRADLAHVARVATLGALTASIAHEINQPLGAIVNNANAGLRWLTANNLHEAQASAALVVADGHRASDILARIRAMVRKAPPDKHWFDVNEALRDVLALTASEARKHAVSIDSRLSDDIPRVCADRVQVQQVALNLVVNAIQATADTAASPRCVTVSSRVADETTVHISVRDLGMGIEPEQLDRLFEPFYSTKPDGLGMGLAISRSIVEEHQGRLWATMNIDRGATFHFTLPAAREPRS